MVSLKPSSGIPCRSGVKAKALPQPAAPAKTWTVAPSSLRPSHPASGRSLSSRAQARLRASARAAVPSDGNSVPRLS